MFWRFSVKILPNKSPWTRLLGADLAGAADDVLECGELFDADGATGVQLAGGDADFGTEAKFAAVGELG